MTRLLLFLGGFPLSLACDAPVTPAGPTRSPAPTAGVSSEPGPTGMPPVDKAEIEALRGEIVELAPAGHYTYLRVGDPGDWAVVLGQLDVELGDSIDLRVQGSKDDFHSHRLGRDFERLFFASVATASTPT
ncbi:MAG: hypothetical protein KUG77_00875 [Nannocystaceae bacterium]|nr:hypothetical protein [Nannocystaceae bacterium]